MPARERVAYLIDDKSDFLEIGAFAGYEMYEEYGGCPAGGVIAGIGYVSGRQCMIVANDATDAVMSSMGIPQIAAIMGSCVAGGAYLPIMSDEALIVEGTGSIFLAGPYLVKAAIGESGGASTQSEISGVTDYKMPDDPTCLDTIRGIVDKFGTFENVGFDRNEPTPPKKDPEELYGYFPEGGLKPYDSLEIIERLVDDSKLIQYKKDYGKTIICAYARIDGWSVGIVANNRKVVKNAKGEMQFGGVIYSDSADKAGFSR